MRPVVKSLSWVALGFALVLYPAAAGAGCPAPGQVTQDGWQLSYATTGTDGLEVTNVTYGGREVIGSIKLAEWQADEGAGGFTLVTGCGGGGGGFQIFPFGETQVLQVPDGFHVTQDFRMPSWGADCNYRFEQRLEFYRGGRFRVSSGAYGRGCGPASYYKPLVRIDLNLAGAGGDRFDYWDGSGWMNLPTEDYRVPYAEADHGPHLLNPDNFAWRVRDATTNFGNWIEPANGQYPDEGPGDHGIVFALRFNTGEGDAHLAVIGSC
jgi:hypothetical protein